MKRLLVFLLLISLILAGCSAPTEENNQTPSETTVQTPSGAKEQVFNDYGFAITVEGTAQIASGSSSNQFTLYSSVGTLEFTYYKTPEVAVTEKNVVDFANTLSENPVVEQLKSNAFLITLPARSAGNNMNVIESYYLITDGTACWRVYAVTIEKTYNKDALVSAMLSLRFAKRS